MGISVFNTMKTILGIATSIAFIVIGFFVVLTVLSNISLFGGYRLYVVQSGSMEPTIHIGDIIFIKSQSGYLKGDAVTFNTNDNRIVTHRIVKVSDEGTYATKGDANRDEDSDLIANEQIMGKVTFVIPKMGYLTQFTRSLPGLIVLILIPASLLIANEFVSIARYGRRPS